MHPMLNIAVRAARKAGNLIAKHYETPDSVETSQKGSNDFVTNVDKAAEAIIIETIRKSYPQHTIITEESGEHAGEDQDIQWVIDPLDGTTNFVKRLRPGRAAERLPSARQQRSRSRRYYHRHRFPVQSEAARYRLHEHPRQHVHRVR